MRFLSTLRNDVRYQIKYGFYFLYAFFSAVYIAALFLCPQEYRRLAAAVILLTDPAMLGSFFIGGIWLLEQSEGLHGYWGVSPLRPIEYIFSKALSMGFISTLSAGLIVLLGVRGPANYPLLLTGIFIGSMLFTILGLTVASYARSVNHYMLLVAPLEVLVTLPPLLAVFWKAPPFLELLPGMALWRVLGRSLGLPASGGAGAYFAFLLWLAAAALFANGRIARAMRLEGGERA